MIEDEKVLLDIGKFIVEVGEAVSAADPGQARERPRALRRTCPTSQAAPVRA